MYKLYRATSVVPTKFNYRWFFLAITVLFLVMLVGCRSKQKFSPDMPGWVQDYISEHRSFMAALERGLLYEEPIVKEQDGVILTIWGVYVEPSATGVIYTVENNEGSHGWARIKIVAVDGKEVNSRPSYNSGNYYAGFAAYEIVEAVNMASEGEHTLTVVLPQEANLTSDIVVDLKVDPSTFKDFYDIKKLSYEETKNDATLKIDRVIYSPTQIWIEYSLTGEKIRDAYLDSLETGDINFIVDGKTLATKADLFYHLTQRDNTIYMRGLVLPRPREITNDTKVVFNKGSFSYYDAEDSDDVTFADPFEIKLPVPNDNADFEPIDEVIVQPYSSLQEAFTAVLEQEEKEYYFANAIFEYRSQNAYENKTPIYNIVVRSSDITDGMAAVKTYEVFAEIIAHEETMLPMTEESLEALKLQQTERIEACKDRTHEVVKMAQDQGRDLAAEAFSLAGGKLYCYYNGDWYIVGLDVSIPQAAYNVETDEFVLAKNAEGLNIINGRPVEK